MQSAGSGELLKAPLDQDLPVVRLPNQFDGGRHKGSRAYDTDCEDPGENFPEDSMTCSPSLRAAASISIGVSPAKAVINSGRAIAEKLTGT